MKNEKIAMALLAVLLLAFLLNPGITSFFSLQTEGTFNVPNFPPHLNFISDITVNESDIVNVNATATDANGDVLNFTYTAPLNSSGKWKTTYQNSGVYHVTVKVSDGILEESQNVTITVLEVEDIDNDGWNDTIDLLWGFNPDVITNTTNVNISVNGSFNLSQLYFGLLPVVIRNNGIVYSEFTFNFTYPCYLILWNVTLNKQGSLDPIGYTYINIFDESCIVDHNKTIYVDEVDTTTDTLCLKDDEIYSISEISENCSGINETLIDCNGTAFGNYVCNKISGRYKTSGFWHSGVKEMNIPVPPPPPPPPPPVCTPSWSCTIWQPATCPITEIQTRTCTDSNSCGTNTGKPAETQSCVYTPTCTDGVKNGAEQGVDCGGTCPACPTCSDGIKNQGETGIDCGGPCAACPTCSDGIKNQGEDKIDCGGPCAACVGCISDADCGAGKQCSGGVCQPKEEKPPVLEEPKKIDVDKIRTASSLSCNDEVKIIETIDEDLKEYKILGSGNVSLPFELPEGYVLAIPPFRLDCKGQSTQIKLAVPENIINLKALRCRGGVCGDVKVSNTTKIGCNTTTESIAEKRSLSLEAMTVKITPVSTTLQEKDASLSTGSYNIKFIQPLANSTVGLEMPSEPLIEPRNKDVKIAGTPVVINVEGEEEKEGNMTMNVTLPYVVDNENDEKSLAIYAQRIEGNETKWLFIGGTINTAKKTITAEINLMDYLQNDQVVLAPLTIYCPDCGLTKFENVFTPSPDSRNAVLLVHGLFSTPKTWEDAVNDIRMTNQPFQLWTFAYPSTKSPEENAKDLAKFLETYEYRYDNIYIIGHSLGALITQQALRSSYDENERNSSNYAYVKKVRDVILVGSPNDGTPFAKYLKYVINNFVNEETEGRTYSISPAGYELLSKGIQIRKVPGINYYVIAGTKPYGFLDVTNLYFNGEPNDGIVSVKSTQNVGGELFDKECENFWSRDVTHTSMTEDVVIRRIVEKIIAKSAKEQLAKAGIRKNILGYTNYFELNVEDCSSDDLYIVIGEQVKESEIEDPLICACGNGECSGFETSENCPKDCFILKIIPCWVYLFITLLFTGFFILGEGIKKYRHTKQKLEKQKTLGRIIKIIIGALMLMASTFILFYYWILEGSYVLACWKYILLSVIIIVLFSFYLDYTYGKEIEEKRKLKKKIKTEIKGKKEKELPKKAKKVAIAPGFTRDIVNLLVNKMKARSYERKIRTICKGLENQETECERRMFVIRTKLQGEYAIGKIEEKLMSEYSAVLNRQLRNIRKLIIAKRFALPYSLKNEIINALNTGAITQMSYSRIKKKIAEEKRLKKSDALRLLSIIESWERRDRYEIAKK